MFPSHPEPLRELAILGPDLLNLSVNSVLKADVAVLTCPVGYADDVATLIATRKASIASVATASLSEASFLGLSWLCSACKWCCKMKRPQDNIYAWKLEQVCIFSTQNTKEPFV